MMLNACQVLFKKKNLNFTGQGLFVYLLITVSLVPRIVIRPTFLT